MLSDIEISQQTTLLPIESIANKLGISPAFLTSYGSYKAKVKLSVLAKENATNKGKLIYVTSMNPTQFGEGKTVTSIGLAQGLHEVGKKAMVCIRQPSLGPVFGTKGGAAGGGYSQVLPMDELNLHCTGDIHAITSAHNLAAAALDARIYHEQRQGYQAFTERTQLQALKINPEHIVWKRAVDHNDRALRMIDIGNNPEGKTINGMARQDGFVITAASELMTIIALAKDLADLRKRVGNVILAYDHNDQPVTADDLQVSGAMTVILKDVIEPTLMQTNEQVPVLVHAGPFANIAHGNSSIIADNIALSVSDYVVTEGGFGSDMGFEKGCNIKARQSGNTPDCAVIVATLKAIKSHSDFSQAQINQDSQISQQALVDGFSNLQWHINNVLKYKIPAVVAINKFPTDNDEEMALLAKMVHQQFHNQPVSVVVSKAFSDGGKGATALANEVVKACELDNQFEFLYPLNIGLQPQIEAIATKGYGAKNVIFTENALQKIARYDAMNLKDMQVCIAKTPVSISDNASLKGAPKDFSITINNIECCQGAGFFYALSGNVMTMPGLSEKPAYMNIDITDAGEITGLF